MPELPEVETVRRGLAPVMEGFTIERAEIRRPDLRMPFPPHFVERLRGRRVTRLERRAKYLLAHLDSGNVLVAHLGMSGSFRIESDGGTTGTAHYYHARSKLGAHDHAIFHMSSGVRIVFNDPRRFGLMDLVAEAELAASRHFKAMGREPLDREFDGAALAKLFAGRKTPLKAALMDQRLIAGLGNIYVCEALWLGGLSPKRAAGTIAGKTGARTVKATKLASAIRAVLEDAIRAGGASLRDPIQTTGELGLFQHSFKVYDREEQPCLRKGCKGTIRRIVQAGRSTFYCPVCQR
jgi:formamidopyrimidine-DNA glycosylase